VLDYRKEQEWKKRINSNKKEKEKGWIRNPIFDELWIKDLPMLYYSILDAELI
jgi:hypothetical protein